MSLEQRRAKCGTRSAFWGWLGLDPRKEKSLVLKQQALDAQHRGSYRGRQLEGLPEWMRSRCFRNQIPSECLLGTESCPDAKFCLMQRISAYREAMTVDA